MRKILLFITLILLLSGCGREEKSDILTGIYEPAIEDGFTALYESEDGYYAVLYANNEWSYDVCLMGAPLKKYFNILKMDENGIVLGKEPLDMESFNAPTAVGQRGFYMIAEDILYHIGWDGTIVSKIPVGSIRPDNMSDSNFCFIWETGDGVAVGWEKSCFLLAEDLTVRETWELPGACDSFAVEGDVVWIIYSQREDRETVWYLGKMEEGTLTETWILPEEVTVSGSSGRGKQMIACEDGWMYGWNRYSGVFRWKFGSDSKEPMIETELDFSNSGINGSDVVSVQKLYGKEKYIIKTAVFNPYNSLADPDEKTILYQKAPDKNLSEITVLTLACQYTSRTMEEAVLRFNREHPETYIEIVSYEQYNTNAEPMAGYDRFELDLNTGLMQADILLNKVFSPLDLYPYMTGEVAPEDIARCVKNAYEKDGALYSIGTHFSFRTLGGRTSSLPDMTSWNLQEFLDFYDSLRDDEYLMEYISQDNCNVVLFNNQVHSFFIRDGQAYFDDPLYVRYLEFMAALPKEGQAYMEHGTNNQGQIAAGELDPEQLQVEAAGENLYYNGKIKLYNTIGSRMMYIHDLRWLLELCEMFGTTEITCIGYPTTGTSGTAVSYTGDVYSIPSTCKDPALAWEFIETALLMTGVQPSEDTLLYSFTTLREPFMTYLQSIRGYQMITFQESGSVNYGWDYVLDADGRYNGKPCMLLAVDDNITALVKNLYENAGYAASVPNQVRRIIEEEESRYLSGVISAEKCAEIVQSRVVIYLSETE